jgi:hypothetical protein
LRRGLAFGLAFTLVRFAPCGACEAGDRHAESAAWIAMG